MSAISSVSILGIWSWFVGILPTVIVCVVAIVAAILINKLLPRIITKVYHKITDDDAALGYFITATKICVWVLALLIVLDKIGFPIASLLTVIAAVGAAVALAIKDNLANLASGIVLLFTKPFKAGDFVEVEGISGTIHDIQLMHTYVDTLTNSRAAVPNTKMMSATINNYSAHELRRQDMFFTVSYDTDIDKAREVIMSVVNGDETILSAPEAPMVAVTSHGENGVQLMLRFWTKGGDFFGTQFRINENVKKAFDANSITIPLPQLDVHMK